MLASSYVHVHGQFHLQDVKQRDATSSKSLSMPKQRTRKESTKKSRSIHKPDKIKRSSSGLEEFDTTGWQVFSSNALFLPTLV